METPEYLKSISMPTSANDAELLIPGATNSTQMGSRPIVNYHCYVNQTDVYSKLIGVRLPYGSAANVIVESDGSITFSSSSNGRIQSRVTVFTDARVVQETLCTATSVSGCRPSTTQISISLESAAILISVLNPSASLKVDKESVAYRTFLSDLEQAKRTDSEECAMYSYGCP